MMTVKEVSDISGVSVRSLHHYDKIGLMYAGGGDMTANIDKMGGDGTAVFANEAIEAYILSK